EELSRASYLSDALFAAIESLSVERDVAAALLRESDRETSRNLRQRLREVRRHTDDPMHRASYTLDRVEFDGVDELHRSIETYFSDIRALRPLIDAEAEKPMKQRKQAFAQRWYDEARATIR